MSVFLRKRFEALKEYVPGEQPQGKTVIKLNTNEAPYPPGPETEAALNHEVAAGLRRYNDPGSLELKKAIAEHYGLRTENVFVSNGSDESLSMAFMGFGEDGAAYPDISYGFYSVFADLYGIPSKVVPLKEDFTIDPEDYADTGMLTVIANPNAPTGLELSLKDLEQIIEENRDHVVVIDEAYADFGTVTAIPLIEKHPNLLVIRTCSKSRAMAGARLGYALGSPGLIRDLEKLKFSTNPYNVNSMTAAAGTAAFRENTYYKEQVEQVKETRARAEEAFRKLGFRVIPSSANFIFVTSDKIDGKTYQEMLKEKGILIRHFDNRRISNYNRITIGTPEEMEKLFRVTEEILENC